MTSITSAPAAAPRPWIGSAAALDRFDCGTPGCSCRATTSLVTAPNVLTVARTLGCAAFTVGAVATMSWQVLLAAVAVYWIGDVCDGILARSTGRETRFGAALDIVCDRACCALVLLGAVALEPAFALPVAVYLLAFVVADTLLSLTFLGWPLLGVNYLRHVDERVWRLNFSPPAKLLNSVVFLLLLLAGQPYAAALAATCALVLKSASLVRMVRRLLARPSGCFSTNSAQP
jgi:CDP-diacylglycerol--glycerol-3-phosphate 3-phosphatidyltransferase